MKHSKKILTIVGNRPQFIKMASVSKAIVEQGYQEIIVHTGQHYDKNLNDIFFEELNIRTPDISLKLDASSHAGMTAEMLVKLEDVFNKVKPKNILVYGDTNSTLAAALVGVKMGIDIAHVESGPRIYDISTPEEINRILTDNASKLRFCPDLTSVKNLAKENMTTGVHLVGDVMYDLFLKFKDKSREYSDLHKRYDLSNNDFLLLTLHRPNNVDNVACLEKLLTFIQTLDQKVLFPVHPRTLVSMKKYKVYEKFSKIPHLIMTEPLGYFDILAAVQNCQMVITDSGGLQKEAFFSKKPCLVCFYETPWPEILETGWQILMGTFDTLDIENLKEKTNNFSIPLIYPKIFGDGDAADKIVEVLVQNQFFYE